MFESLAQVATDGNITPSEISYWIKLLVGAIVALGGVVGFLWREGNKRSQLTEERLTAKLAHCETEHESRRVELRETDARVADLKGELGELRGQLQAENEVKPALAELSKAVLQLVHAHAVAPPVIHPSHASGSVQHGSRPITGDTA